MISDALTKLVKDFGAWAAFLALLLSGVLSPFGLDNLVGGYVFLLAALIFALGAWKVWPAVIPLKGAVLVIIVGVAAIWGYLLWWASQPHFEITAFDTLESDKNAYELTDMLIWNQDNLDEYGASITFTLEIRPTYFGRQRFGRVIALISGDDGAFLEKPLWDDFTKDSSTRQIQLTLPELLRASGLKVNSDPASNHFGPGDPPFQRAKLIVRVAREADKTNPWDSGEITIRNAPWEQRSELVWRNNGYEVDVYVRNLGGASSFTVNYHLVRMDNPVSDSSHPKLSGTTTIKSWNEPTTFKHLKYGDYFTDTVSLPDGLNPGRYLLEVLSLKKQEFVQFNDTTIAWENLPSRGPWWWFSGPFQHIVFVVPQGPFPVEPTIQAELERLRTQQVIDLGLPIGSTEEVTSDTETMGQRQVFQKGEIYVRDSQPYALYGPILEHYRELGGMQNQWLGFPISPIQTVTSSSGTEGNMMEFEGSAVIYASKHGVAAALGWIGEVYLKNGSYSGWLGFPLTDEQYRADSTVQMFESGYVVYYYPYVNGERDWGRKPIAYPYLASSGTLFDVHAQQHWQSTGVTIQIGDQVTIVQVGGSWANDPDDSPFDANGDPDESLQEDTVLPSAVPGTLIGRIGENDGQAFAVGRWHTFTSPANGTLYVAMNSSSYEDNAGFITVQIMVDRSE